MRRWLEIPLRLTCLPALWLAACQGDGQGSPSPEAGGDALSGNDGATASDAATGGDTATGGDAIGPGDDGGGDATCTANELPSPACNPIVASGPLVVTTSSPGAAPQPQGGVLPDGTYVLQSATFYGGSLPAQTYQTTWVICGDHWDVADNLIAADGGASPVHVDYAATVQGSSVMLNPSCASLQSVNTPMTSGFSVFGNQVTFFQNVQGLTLVSTFAQQ